MTNSSFLDNLDEEKVNQLLDRTENNMKSFSNLYTNIANGYLEPLDSLMKDLYVQCIKDDDASTETLTKYYLELSNLVYFMNETLEKVGVLADMSESQSKEIYQKIYLSNQTKDGLGKNKTTVAENQAVAELGSQYERVVSSLYSHVYKLVKAKVSSAQDMMNTLRKILSVRTEEMNNEKFSPTNM